MTKIITIVCVLLLMVATASAVTLTRGADGVIFGWQVGDRVGFLTAEGVQMPFRVADIAADNHSATVQSPGWSLKHDVCYYAYAPYNTRYTTAECRATALPLDISLQQQTGNDNTDHLGAQSFYMGRVMVAQSDTDVQVNLYPLTSVLRITQRMRVPFDLKQVLVTVGDHKIPLLGTVNLINGEFTPQANARTLTLNTADIHAARGEDITVYLTMPPCNLEGETIEIVFVANDGETDEWILPGFDIQSGYTYCIGGDQDATEAQSYTPMAQGTVSTPVVLAADMPIAGSYIATRINVQRTSETRSHTPYSLWGLPLSSPSKGIMISNGKKILIY